MKDFILSPISLKELKEVFGQVVEEKLKAALTGMSNASESNSEQYVTRKEVAERLRISLPTLNTLTRHETIKGYRIGGRVLYKWNEVEAVLSVITTTKYKRKEFISK